MDRSVQWAIVAVLVAALTYSAVVTRYEYPPQGQGLFRIDRWTGDRQAWDCVAVVKGEATTAEIEQILAKLPPRDPVEIIRDLPHRRALAEGVRILNASPFYRELYRLRGADTTGCLRYGWKRDT